MIEGVRLIQWKVPDLELATRWYARVLDTEPWRRDDHCTTFQSCGIWLELRLGQLRLAASQAGPEEKAEVPPAHAPIVFFGVEDLQSAWMRLQSMGVPLRAAQPAPYPDTKAATFEDPFGRTVGLMERNDPQVLRARAQRAAEKVALRHVRHKLNEMEQDEADKQRAAKMLARIAAGLGVFILATVLYSAWSTPAREPTVNAKELMQKP